MVIIRFVVIKKKCDSIKVYGKYFSEKYYWKNQLSKQCVDNQQQKMTLFLQILQISSEKRSVGCFASLIYSSFWIIICNSVYAAFEVLFDLDFNKFLETIC